MGTAAGYPPKRHGTSAPAGQQGSHVPADTEAAQDAPHGRVANARGEPGVLDLTPLRGLVPELAEELRKVRPRERIARALRQAADKAFAEWLVDADHTGPLVLSEDSALEATGRHVVLPGVTVADFREGKIRSFRTYFDDLSLIEQIVGA